MNKKTLAALLLISSIHQSTQADVYGYLSWMPDMINKTLRSAGKVYDQVPVPASCQTEYASMLAKDTIDVRYALGYFDDSTGKEIRVGFSNLGLSPSLDPEVHQSLREAFSRPCRGPKDVVCGFMVSGPMERGRTVFSKKFVFMGKTKNLRITMTHASASPYFRQNTAAGNQRQATLTAQSEANYFDGLATADVVFYNGHSRNGGGPDFNPVRLNSVLKPDYAWYQSKTPGLNRLVSQLQARRESNAVIGMFSCYSHKNFSARFRRDLPGQAAILSVGTIDYHDALRGSLIYLEGVLRGHCGQSLQAGVAADKKVSQTFNIFGQ